MSLTKVSYSMITGSAVNVLDYGVIADGITNNTAALALALASVPANGTLYFPAGVYCGYLLLRRSNITIMGDGSASTTLKLPNNCPTITVAHDGAPNPITGLPNVIEIGEAALGNIANTYSRVNVIGITLDGNYSNNTAPTTDLFGHGMILTKTSNCFIYDVVAQNCHLTGIDNVINSNYNTINATCTSCGNALIGASYYPNFDINSSKYGTFNITSVAGAYGGRMLDNCWNNTLTLRSSNPGYTGFVYENQTGNVSSTNIINVSVYDGCASGQGVSVGKSCSNSIINATVYSTVGTGVLVNGSSTLSSSGNTFNINTQECGGAGVNVGAYASYNAFNITSNKDGRSGAAGDNFAIDVYGDYNQFSVVIKEGAAPQTRGLVFRSGADNNQLTSFLFDPTLVELVSDLGAGNYTNHPAGVSASVASATTIFIPFIGTLIPVTGTTTIVIITANLYNTGRTITLQFAASVQVAVSGNIKLAGTTAFNATASDTLTLICDGTSWIEVARTVI